MVETTDQMLVAVPPAIVTIPDRFKSRTLAEFDPSVSAAAAASLEAARAMTQRATPARSLVLSGPPGGGKTHLAAGICNAVWERDYEAASARDDEYERNYRAGDAEDLRYGPPALMPRWANVPAFINRLRGGDDDVRAEARHLGRYEGLVVLDDLGREKVTEWTGETIYVLVNERYERLLPTIVTTNLSVKELAENGYGPAISRLAEDGRLVEMASAIDYRSRRP